MTDATKPRDSAKPGFSARWMLDRPREHDTDVVLDGDPGPVHAQAHASPAAGADDTDARPLHAEAPTVRRSFAAVLGTWIARSLVTIVLVASLVMAAAAATSLFHTREELAAARTELTRERDAALAARTDDAETAERIAELELAANESESAARTAAADVAALELEVKVLRGMLLDDASADTIDGARNEARGSDDDAATATATEQEPESETETETESRP